MLTLSWTSVTAGTSPGGNILGYQLSIKDCLNGTTWIAFDGEAMNLPS
jgi:hypothetical protein